MNPSPPNNKNPALAVKGKWKIFLFLIGVILFFYWAIVFNRPASPNYPVAVDSTCHSVTVTETTIIRDEQGKQLFINGNIPTTETGTECGNGQFYPSLDPPGN
ncbi:MAG: hypothetical protein P4L74_02505 [Candidatus Doudnabacteria bacterium]|nr:hypothetical protein [Candidatus Doudnabacteria bacterium]